MNEKEFTESIEALPETIMREMEAQFKPDDFIFHPDSMMNLMGWSEADLQEAINDGRVALINWEGGGQSVCTPNSVWLKK